MTLFGDEAALADTADKESQLRLQDTLDTLRDRYCENIVKRGSDLRKNKR
jgi:hypothetical protein